MRKLFALLALLCAAPALAQIGGGFPPSVPNPILCTTACTKSLSIGQSLYVVKQVQTSRNTTSTLTADPDLQVSCTNCLQVEAQVEILYNITTAAQGAKFQVFFGTLGTCSGSGFGNALAYGQLTSAAGQLQDWNANGFSNTSGTGNFFFYSSGQVNGTNANLTVCWAQAVSGATNTFVNNPSYIRFTRIQ